MSSTRHLINGSTSTWRFSFNMPDGDPSKESRRDDRLTWWHDWAQKGTGSHAFGEYIYTNTSGLWQFKSKWFDIKPKERIAVRCREHVKGWWSFKDKHGYVPQAFQVEWRNGGKYCDGELWLSKDHYVEAIITGSVQFDIPTGGDINILDDSWQKKPYGVKKKDWDKRVGANIHRHNK